ncbi:MAG: proline/glycine betaine ABC transporter permease [Dehalococcoidia bacterium]|nr:proline/glycine betaine ABC transporter permease [Dehalococcoidia bacterium]
MNDLRRKFLKGNLISAWIVLSLVAAAYLLRRFGQDLGLLNKKMTFPWEWSRPIEDAIDGSISWITRNGAFIFDPTSDLILDFLLKLEAILLWIPWPVVIIAIGWISWKSAGRGVMIFSATALLTLGIFDLWDSTMETIALITVAVLLSIVIAIPTGIVASRSDKLDVVLRPVLDGMQTMPSFVYLVPAIMFFGIGNVPAVIATIIYAVPPAIRLTNLGIRQVSAETIEAARSFGTTNRQLLIKVQIPMAVPTIMAGINQTIMMAVAMAVIASLVGAGGLGEDVNRALGRIEPGEALLAGLGIVFLAIIVDRITQSAAKKRQAALEGPKL